VGNSIFRGRCRVLELEDQKDLKQRLKTEYEKAKRALEAMNKSDDSKQRSPNLRGAYVMFVWPGNRSKTVLPLNSEGSEAEGA
jgi:hypothetical protein